ncbi:hypothetical protein [Verrucomicrobium sp. BvORR106]|uniref:hypothetical protein n=1 Tax=Verrucomicrobium sp. BvORR106 TaxID=1403819 RepID=UPI002240FAD1|nr:hypothetical protein [Verrucomicrobium sp. BvORR106]
MKSLLVLVFVALPMTSGLSTAPALSALLRSPAEKVTLEQSYSWGSVKLSANRTGPPAGGSKRTMTFEGDVLAKFHFPDGRRFLLATGHLELDPITGDFVGTGWPFFLAVGKSTRLQFSAADETAQVQLEGGKLRTRNTGRVHLGKEPEIMGQRRDQLARLEKGL